MGADLVLLNGEIISMDEKANKYQAIAIKNGKIIGLGDSNEIGSFISKETKIIDLEEKVVLPGFIDAHQHIVSKGFNLIHVDCNKSSICEVVKAIEERVEKAKPHDWIIGLGYDESKFEEQRSPNVDDFNHIENPVFINRFCLHTAVVNGAALSLANVDENTTIPGEGEIQIDKHGRLTGILREKAMDLIKKVMPPYTVEQIKEAISMASSHYLSKGITSVHEAGMGFYTDSNREFRALQEMSTDGSLRVRVYGMILDTFFEDAKAMGLVTGFGNDRLKIGSIKMFADGTLSGRTAAVTQPYLDPKDTKGMLMYSNKELEEKVMNAHKEGYQIGIHGIGDRCIEQIITAYEKAIAKYPRKNHRHRIEHTGLTTSKLLKQMKDLEIIPVPHPGIVHIAGDTYTKVLSESVIKGLYAIKSFFKEGLRPAGSSDAPVVPSSPLLGIYTTMTRMTVSGDIVTPEERISLYESLKMYTVNAAYASFSENELGTIEKGKFGDLVVLPKGFMNFTPEQIKNTEIEYTIVGGELSFENNNHAMRTV